ncbi:MAG: Ig-like domain-containing protein, partial [Bacteroidota bacterium]
AVSVTNGSASTIESPEIAADWTGGYVYYLGAHSGASWTREITESFPGRVSFEAVDINRWPFDPHNPTEIRNGNRGQFYLFGLLDALDYEREWYYDGNEEYVYFQAPNNSNPNTLQVEIAQRVRTMNLTQDYIHVDGINAFGGKIEIRGENCVIKNGTFKECFHSLDAFNNVNAQISDGAIAVRASNTTIERNVIDGGSLNGIHVQGFNNVNNVLIRYNYIQNFNTIGNHSSPIRSGAQNTRIISNTIRTTGRDGIYVAGTNSEIAYNDVSDCMRINNDGGVFYTVGNDFDKNNVIHHNWFHDSFGPEYADGRAAGIYLDNDSKGYLVHNNVVWNVTWSGIQINWDNWNLDIFNNTIYNVGEGMGRWENGFRLEDVVLKNNFASEEEWFGTDIAEATNIINAIDPFTSFDNQNFVPKPGSFLSNGGEVIEGITDGFQGPKPDIGAYEGGLTPWVPGVNTVLGGEADGTAPETIPITAINLLPESVRLKVGDVLTFETEALPLDATDTTLNLIWSVADANVAEVDENGTVTGRSEGITEVIAMAENGIVGKAEILIIPEDRERFIRFDNKEAFIPDGSTVPVFGVGETAAIALSYATNVTDGEIEDLAFVSLRIRQLNESGGQVAASPFVLTIPGSEPDADSLTLDYTLPTIFTNGSTIPVSADLPEGHQLQLMVRMVADNATGRSFSNDDTNIILIKRVSEVVVSPERVVLRSGEQVNLTATVEPADASNQEVNWSSSDETVATVDSVGLLTAVGGGEAFIIVTTEDGGLTDTTFVQVQTAYLSMSPIPGVLEAENYDLGGSNVGYLDNTEGNSGSAYRTDDVDIEETTDLNGGFHVTDTESGEWLAFTADVSATGAYYLSVRASSTTEGGSFFIMKDSVELTGPVPVPNTGGLWETVSVLSPVALSEGVQELKVMIGAGGADLNYLELIEVPSSCLGVADWASGIIYNTGDQVLYEGLLYQAKYYTTSLPTGNAWDIIGHCGAAYPDCYDVPVWEHTGTYPASGTQIAHEGILYTNLWYASPGQEPGLSDVWQYEGPCSSVSLSTPSSPCPEDVYPWNGSATYPGAGTYVSHNGNLYVNQWYASPGQEPGIASVWKIGQACTPTGVEPSCPDVATWEPRVYSVAGTEVIHDGGIYTNMWYASANQEPGTASVWQYEGPCAGATSARVASQNVSVPKLSITPNPFSSYLVLSLNGENHYTQVEVLDLQGRIIAALPISPEDNEVKIALEDKKLDDGGIYLFLLTSSLS